MKVTPTLLTIGICRVRPDVHSNGYRHSILDAPKPATCIRLDAVLDEAADIAKSLTGNRDI